MKNPIYILLFISFLLLPINASAQSTSVYAARYCTTISCDGAADIGITSEKYTKISIFKKGLFSYQLLKSNMSSKKMNYTSKLSGRNKYYIVVASRIKKPCRIRISVNQHQDKKYSLQGGVWNVKAASPFVNSSLIYRKKFFFTRAQCSQALAYCEKAKYLEYQSRLVNGTLSVTGLLLGASGIRSLNVASAFLSIAQIGYSFDFKKNTMQKIKNYGGYSSRTGSFSRGIVLSEYISRGISFLQVEGWYGGEMSGPKGFLGTWSQR